MQCKDIPDKSILEFLELMYPDWCNWFEPLNNEHSVIRAMPGDTVPKLALAKMSQLIRRGFVEGCDCGCRGDFVITQKGRDYLCA